MIKFTELSDYNGFDKDIHNGIQNSYAWCMSELEDYIYVGTNRNLLYSLIISFAGQEISLPFAITPDERYIDMNPEVWRYKKDGSLPWKRVFKGNGGLGTGFRFMINHKPLLSREALYIASAGNEVKILKSTNGVFWFELDTSSVAGGSSRSMVSFNNKLYISTLTECLGGNRPLIYVSPDPEIHPFEAVFPLDMTLEKGKNPSGGIANLVVFNNRLYACVSSESGIEVWRSNSAEPKANDWTLVVDNGFGDLSNVNVLAANVYDDHLYVSGTKDLISALLLPQGFDLIRIDKKDNWELVVGGYPYIPAKSVNGRRGKSLSGYQSGFNSHFNLYGWQIQEYNDSLFVSTFDHSVNINLIRDVILLNRDIFNNALGEIPTNLLLILYSIILYIFDAINYHYGFDLFGSPNGVDFTKIISSGLGTDTNYGGRILFVDPENNFYLSTANPYLGCEVWQISTIDKKHHSYDVMYCNESDLLSTLYNIYDLIVRLYYLIKTARSSGNNALLSSMEKLTTNSSILEKLRNISDKFTEAHNNDSVSFLLFELLDTNGISIPLDLMKEQGFDDVALVDFITKSLKQFLDNHPLEELLDIIVDKLSE